MADAETCQQAFEKGQTPALLLLADRYERGETTPENNKLVAVPA